MKTTMIRAVAALSLAAAALMAPAAAHAYTDPVVVSVSPSSVAPGGVATFTTPQTSFDADETIAISITGVNASGATLASVAVQTNDSLRTKAVDGRLNVPITLPSNASGTYYLTFTGLTSERVLHSSITVAAVGSPAHPSKGGLAVTGIDAGATAGIWIAGAGLVAAGGAVAVGAAVRRRRAANG